ncbi:MULTISPECIES: hypothetical protein [unclassified Cryobacterium]|uniref:hypothetical protein n=1 Tax=unclassified Cryobacterium TaxID=2649013 RepID=UPI001F544BFD|nr:MULTISPECIES: hypothetical protein [unclassified Cryobacterium]
MGSVIEMRDYWTIAGFAGLYLEDSWVLHIVARPGVLEFVVDLVLQESHPSYEAPQTGEQYCYRRGVIRFDTVSSLDWKGQGAVPAVDATGEPDYGSIDALEASEDGYVLEGDFGRIAVTSAAPSGVFGECDEI